MRTVSKNRMMFPSLTVCGSDGNEHLNGITEQVVRGAGDYKGFFLNMSYTTISENGCIPTV